MKETYYSHAILAATREEMERDQNVFLMGEDVGKFGGGFGTSQGLLEQFGDLRVIDTPISESAYMTAGVGASIAGKRPIVDVMFADLVTYGFDSLVNQAAKFNYVTDGQVHCPMVLLTPQGIGGSMGPQHSQSIESWFANVPGLKIVTPSTAYDAKGLMKSAIRDNNPVLFLAHKALMATKGPVPEEEYTIPLGKAKVVKEGKDVTIIAYHLMLSFAMEAAAELEKKGISVEIIDPRTLVPLDTETIYESVRKTGRAVVVTEAYKTGGFGGEIASLIADECFDELKAPIKRLGSVGIPFPMGKNEFLLVPSKDNIMEAVNEIMK